MAAENLAEQAGRVAEKAGELAAVARALAEQAANTVTAVVNGAPAPEATPGPFWYLFTIFVLAIFVGYYVVWRVTPALHSPLMAVTNAISSVIIVGALIAAGPAHFSASQVMGFLAVILASVNIFGGFIVTQRMLSMFKKKK